MTAVLNALRALDARLDRGEITPEEYARRRTNLLSAVEDAHTDFIDITPRERPALPRGSGRDDRPAASSAASLGLVVVLSVMGVCIALALLVLGNMNLALTLGVTILAALSVALLHHGEG
jgi:hypothetical protein